MKTVLTIFFFSTIYLYPLVFSQEGKLSVYLSMDKDTYIEGELMTAKLKFTNINKSKITVWHNCYIEDDILFSMRFVNEKEMVYKLESSLSVDCIGTQIILKPGESFDVNVPVLLNNIHSFKGLEYLPTGVYKVTSNFYGTSNIVEVKVVEK